MWLFLLFLVVVIVVLVIVLKRAVARTWAEFGVWVRARLRALIEG